MENKNFEKKKDKDAPHDVIFSSNLYSIWTEGYNTCLDRTNAKGIYEACLKVLEWNKKYPPGRIYSYDRAIDMESELQKAFTELQTELKKAELHGVD